MKWIDLRESKNMRTLIVFFLVAAITFFSSCQESNSKYISQFKTVDNLMKALYDYDTVKIRSLIGVNPREIGEDDYHFLYKVQAANKLLRLYGLPARESYNVKEYSTNDVNLIDVVVPIIRDSLQSNKAEIFINFVRFLPANKVAFFRLDASNSPGTIQAPDSLRNL